MAAGSRLSLLLFASCTILTTTSAQNYYFTGALQVVYGQSSTNGQTSYAVQAQCPSTHPMSCGSISEPDYCCPYNTYCTWSDSRVACCQSDCTCSGWDDSGAGGGGGGYYQSTTTDYYQPTTTSEYYPEETTTVYDQSEPTTTDYVQTTTQNTVVPLYGDYCSTMTESGPDLPATGRGDCGTILIVAPSNGARELRSLFWSVVGVGGLWAIGGMLLVLR